jgi:mono/diheme cytochrome c family protein
MLTRIFFIAGGGVAVLTILGLMAWDRFTAVPFDGTDTQQVARGQGVYNERCASCHGKHLEGQPNWREREPNGFLPAPPHDASGHTWHHPDDVLLGITKRGLAPYAPPGYESDMPAFGDTLTDHDIRAALAYIKSQWPPEIRERQAAITKQAQKADRRAADRFLTESGT